MVMNPYTGSLMILRCGWCMNEISKIRKGGKTKKKVVTRVSKLYERMAEITKNFEKHWKMDE